MEATQLYHEENQPDDGRPSASHGESGGRVVKANHSGSIGRLSLVRTQEAVITEFDPQEKVPSEERVAVEALNAAFRVPLTRYFVRRVRNDADAEDMVQEVFERLIKRGDIGSVEFLTGYVFETASSVFTDRFRRRTARQADEHDEFDENVHGDVQISTERIAMGRERLANATTALLELPERTRVIFVLRRLEGMSYVDIEERLGISVSAIEKHMQRAVAHLAKRLEGT